MRRAYRFLAENREMAYSREEVAGAVGGPEDMDDALPALVRIMAVERREIRGVEYFRLASRVRYRHLVVSQAF